MSLKSVSLLCAVAALVASGALADSAAKKNAFDKNGGTVVSKGGCVITKWTAANDPCAPKAEPAPAPAPVPVAAPAPAPAPAPKFSKEALTVYFAFDKSEIDAEGQGKLKYIAEAVNKSPQIVKVGIVGYTDQMGSDDYNNKLSLDRANNVKAYLDTLSRIPAEVVGLRALGKADPVVQCDEKMKRDERVACLAKNRRVEVEFEYQE